MKTRVGTLAIAGALAERDLAGRLSYRLTFVFEAAGAVFLLAALFYAGKLVPRSALGGQDYFTITLIGMGVQAFLLQIATAPRAFLANELGTGALETILTAGPRLETMLNAAVLNGGLRSAERFALVFLVAVVLGDGMRFGVETTGLLVVAGLAAICGVGFGYLQAGLELATRRSSRILGILRGGGFVFTGVYFPVVLLPEPLQTVSGFLPTTHLVSAARSILMAGALPIRECAILAAMGFALVLLGRRVLRRGIEAMLRDGSYLRY